MVEFNGHCAIRSSYEKQLSRNARVCGRQPWNGPPALTMVDRKGSFTMAKLNLCEILDTDAEHLVQKVSTFSKTDIKYPCIVQEKYDGVYCIARRINDSVHFFSRSGNEFLSMNHLQDPINELLTSSNSDFIIFEAYSPGTPLNVITGWCRDSKRQHEEIKGIVHDCLTTGEYSNNSPTPYQKRLARLVSAFNSVNGADRLLLPDQITAKTYADIDLFVNAIWSKSGEGIVIKNPSAPYTRGSRNVNLMKLKRAMSYDLEVIDLEEGQGKYKFMTGKLICRWKNGTTINVGSGLSDDQRAQWWTNKSAIIGKIVQVDAMSLSSKGQLREPVFKCVRLDKVSGDFSS